MKKFLLIAAVAAFAACNNDNSKVESMNTKSDSSSGKMSDENMNYPYSSDYSHDFEMGDPKNAMSLLQLYKNWDANNLDEAKQFFAENNDSMFFSDGNMFAGSRDSLFSIAKQMRAQMGTVSDTVHAWVPLRSKDRNEDWVLIWTTEMATDAKGKTTARELHEAWRFDKNGKINMMRQYEAKPPAMGAPPPPPKK